MKMGDAGSRPPVVFADACRTTPSLPLPELRHAHVPRASTVLISYGPVWPQLTHCSASINIAAALSCLLTSAENQILLQNFLINFVTDARSMSDKI